MQIMSKRNNQNGFSLLELSVAIVVLSLALVTAIQIGKIKSYEFLEEDQKKSYEQVNNLLLAYYIGFDEVGNRIQRLPCPARNNLPLEHPDFGVEDCASATLIDSGIPDPRAPGNNLQIMTGAFPINAVSAPIKHAYDVHGGQYLYAVSADLVLKENFLASNLNAVQVQNLSNAPTGGPLPYTIISMGENQFGAIGSDWNVIVPCPANDREGENCDGDNVFIDAYAPIAGYPNGPETAFFDGRLGYDHDFFNRITNAIFANIECPANEFLKGFVGGEPQCALWLLFQQQVVTESIPI